MRALRNAAWAALLGGCQTMGVVLGEPSSDAGGGYDVTIVEAGASDGPGTPGDASPVVVGLGGGDAETSEHGDPNGGVPFLDLCPDGQALVGLQGNLAADSSSFIVGAVQALCASMAVDVSSGQVTTSPGAMLAVQGTGPANAWTQTCAAGQVAVGFMGRSGLALDQAALECASLTADLAAGSFSMGPVVVLDTAGGDGGLPFQSPCPNGELARGLVGRSGQWIDYLGLACAAPVLGGSDP